MSLVLQNQPWLDDPAARAVIGAIHAAGGEARFVGGCVRNAVMGEPVDDVDIAATLTPDRTAAALAAAGLRSVPTGLDHGTVTAIVEGKPFEVTSLRRDVATDGRRAVVAFTTDWSEDAQRRDFTFNALYADLSGAVLDPTGRGLADASAGRVVFVGESYRRIAEDYLRILRYFRFLAWYGRGEPDAEALAACGELREGLARISAERIGKEMLKLLAAPAPQAAVGLMASSGVLARVLPNASEFSRFNVLAARTRDPLMRLAALLPDAPGVAEAAIRALRLSNRQGDRLIAALTPDVKITPGLDAVPARRLAHRLGVQAFLDRLQLEAAARDVEPGPALIALADWSAPTLPVGGADVLALGVRPGPEVGKVLAQLEAWFIAQDFQPDRTTALAELQALIKARA